MTGYQFIIIDDDPFSNKVSSVLIRSLYNVEAKVFTIPEEGFQYVVSGELPEKGNLTPVILLDINMPGMSGWDFLAGLEQYPLLHHQFNLFIISSSIDINDIYKSHEHPLVIDFISKPVSRLSLMEAMKKVV